MKIIDQLGNTITFSDFPKKIISIVPSQTELLFDLGLDEEIIGITDFCIHPKDWHETKTKIGGTKKINIEKIKELKPDIIIGNKEENERTDIEELMKYFPVWMSDIKNLEDAFLMIESIGKISGKENNALAIQNDIKEQFAHFKLALKNISMPNKRIAYFIWRKPFIVAGSNTFINHLLTTCGFENVFTKINSRYPEITFKEIQKGNPEIIFLSSEPYPFSKKHIEEFQQLCPHAKIVLVNGEMFSWYGSRLLYAPAYFERLLQNL